jgi:hypothetical protein
VEATGQAQVARDDAPKIPISAVGNRSRDKVCDEISWTLPNVSLELETRVVQMWWKC